MQHDAKSPDAYLAALDEDWRKARLLEVRALMMRLVPGLEESIGYGMLEYRHNGEVLAHLNAQKSFVGVYLGDLAPLDPGTRVIGDLDTGKGCVRLRRRDSAAVLAPLLERKRELGGGAC